MKSLIIVSLLMTAPLYAECPKGTTEYEGVCAADLPSEKAPAVQPSDEKPSKHPEPAWERGEVHADMPVSLIDQDRKMDEIQNQAIEDGKKAAGL